MNRAQAAEQVRKALQILAAEIPEKRVIEVAAVFDPWQTGKSYTAGEYVHYGMNGVGDPQLYKVVQAHTSQAEWTPDITSSLYDAIGLDGNGYPVWCQPAGAHDAYNAGDIVSYNGTIYQSLMDGNVYSPESYSDGWKVYEQ